MFGEPIDHVLVRRKLCSIRSANSFLKNNEVLVDDERVLDRKTLVDCEYGKFTINGVVLPKILHLYFMMYKPKGVVCSRKSSRHTTIYDIIPDAVKLHPFYPYLHTIGRLDCDTTGIILLTSNGVFSNKLTNPDTFISKEYRVFLRDEIPNKDKNKYILNFLSGFELPSEKKAPGFFTKPALLKFISNNECILEIIEGKFHQVRRMFKYFGNEVVQLERISIAGISLPSNFIKGNVKYLYSEDLKYFENCLANTGV